MAATADIELIVLNYTKFGENSIVLHTLSREYGRRSFLVRIGQKTSMALFLPLNILEAQIRENPKSTLGYAGKFTARTALNGIRNNLYKNSMTLFMSEVLFKTLAEGADEDGIYDWCLREIITLDSLDRDFSNFHLLFLLEFAIALGFRPTLEDLLPFVKDNASLVRRLLELPYEEAMLVPMTGQTRNDLCAAIIEYLEFHTETRINIKSLGVLRELFG